MWTLAVLSLLMPPGEAETVAGDLIEDFVFGNEPIAITGPHAGENFLEGFLPRACAVVIERAAEQAG